MNLKERGKIIFKQIFVERLNSFLITGKEKLSRLQEYFPLNNLSAKKLKLWNCATNLWHFMSTAVVECRSLSHDLPGSFSVSPKIKFSSSSLQQKTLWLIKTRWSVEEIYRQRERRKKLQYFAQIKIKLTLGTVWKIQSRSQMSWQNLRVNGC